jgi:hypothetical protein
MFAGILVQFAAIVARMGGILIPHRWLNGAFLLVLGAPLITAVAFNVAPRMICRNCQATWRTGKNLPS